MNAKEYWDFIVKNFPIRKYCLEHSYAFGRGQLTKDCANCLYLRFGRCTKNRIPDIKGDLDWKPAKGEQKP